MYVRFCGGGVGAAHDHCQNEAMALSTGTTKPDEVCLAAVDLARAAAEETAQRLAAAQADEKRLRQLWREAQTKVAQTREVLTAMERQARETEAKIAAV